MNASMAESQLILHVFPTFDVGGSQARMTQLANAWGGRVSHAIVAGDGQTGALALLAPEVPVQVLRSFPALKGGLLPQRLWSIGQALRRHPADLLCTYNWGAIEVALANALFARKPHIHHEDGFGPDEAVRPNPRRALLRRLTLRRADGVMVPSGALERMALELWRLPPAHVHRIANGITPADFTGAPAPGALDGFSRRPGELIVGSVAGLRPEKAPTRLVRVFAQALTLLGTAPARLVMVGSGPQADAVRAEAARLGIAERVVLAGFHPQPQRYLNLFDLFVIPSDTEQFPISLVEAMAAGLAVAATDVGDVRLILPAAQHGYLAAPQDELALARAIAALLADAGQRDRLGAGNRSHVCAHYTLAQTVEAFEQLYGGAIARHRTGSLPRLLASRSPGSRT